MKEKDSLYHIEGRNWDLTDQTKLLCEENHHPGPYRPASTTPPPPKDNNPEYNKHSWCVATQSLAAQIMATLPNNNDGA